MGKGMALCLLVVLALAGCGSGEARMSAAVQAVDPNLRSIYSYAYAGMDADGDRLVIYRKPDAPLEAFVRERAQGAGVEVEFRDAPYSLDELEPLTERVFGDGPYWSSREFTVKWVIPRPDGTGVTAFVTGGNLDTARAEFRERYGDEPIVVDRPARGGIVPI